MKEFYDNLNLNQGENSEEVVEAVAIAVAIPVAVPVIEARIENNVRVIKIKPANENDILERKLLEIGILH